LEKMRKTTGGRGRLRKARQAPVQES
jgi:hypothetical protein